MISWDLETFYSMPGFQAPIPVCATTHDPDNGTRLWLTHELDACMAELARHDKVVVHHGAFDFAVMAEWRPQWRPLIWQLYEEDCVYDTSNAQRIIQIQRGFDGLLNLSFVAGQYGILMPSKKDEEIREIRNSFGEFLNKELPPAHREYAMGDASATYQLIHRQLETGLVSARDLTDLGRRSFWLQLVAINGFRAEAARVEQLKAWLGEELGKLEEIAIQQGFIRYIGKRNPKKQQHQKAIREAVAAAYRRNGREVPYVDRDPRKNVSMDRLALEDADDGPGDGTPGPLQKLASWNQLRAIMNKDIPLLEAAVHEPQHSEFRIADTLRSITANPNQQNMGKLKGVRECIVPRQGAFVHADFGNLENVALAQLIIDNLGLHNMANKLNAGIDLHAEVGATILFGAPLTQEKYDKLQALREAGDQAAEDARNGSKPANYGLSGGMKDPLTFQQYARKGYGVIMDLPTTIKVMEAWFETATDQVAWVRHQEAQDALYLPNSDIVRRGVRPTVRCNAPFQKLGGDVAMLSGWLLAREQYLKGTLPGRMTLFIHDEHVVDCEPRKETYIEVARIMEGVMVKAAAEILPSMKMKVDVKVLDRYSKAKGKGKWQDGTLSLVKL